MRSSWNSSAAALAALACAAPLLAPPQRARAQEAPPGPHEAQQFDFMHLLARRGLHDIEEESWNAYGQLTWIQQFKPSFPARYTNLNGSHNSLSPVQEWGFTGTATLYFGVHLWKGAEAYVVPEVIAEHPFSGLHGLTGAIQDFELQKGGTDSPQLYRSRAFVKQTIELGGERVAVDSNPMQLATAYRSRRLFFVLGSFSVLDFFDKIPFDIDPRQGFFGLAYLTYPAYDFASDARGYSWGGVVELDWDAWALRFGRVTPPAEPNQLPIDFRLWEYYGDQIELEHDHRILGREGKVRLLGYHTHAIMGRFNDAVAAFEANPQENAAACPTGAFNYGSTNATAPDLCWVRKPDDKWGIGLYVEQYLTRDIGLFARGMYSDGQTEVDAYTSADSSLTLGVLGKGSLWHRPADVTGIGGNLSWVSPEHARYLAMGGIDGFIGDGSLTAAPESSLDVFYSANVLSSVWLGADYQFIANPGMNADRGPLSVLGARVHVEF
ncbi:MAG: carbohydrate porin [Myxococcales bacterium]